MRPLRSAACWAVTILATLCWGVAAASARETGDAVATAAATKLVLASPFSDHMVLQRDKFVPVWGWSAVGAEVEVTFAGETQRAVADATGRWEVALGPLDLQEDAATLTVATGDQRIEVHDVLVGDVWVASGQSNMEWRVANSNDAEQEVAAAEWPNIRLLDIPHAVAEMPQDRVNNPGWQPCTPASVGNFSAVAYFFGRKLYQDVDVPIGLISVNWGGTPMEAWTSRDVLAATETFGDSMRSLTPFDQLDKQQQRSPHRPGVLYNGMLAPVIPYAMRGAIWYQGESNAGRAGQYRELSELMITNWRQQWKQGDFPFLLVQLAGWERGGDSWPYLREAQLRTLELPNTGLAVATDIGHRTDIHPRNKQEVGRRLALAALALSYGKDVEFSGPTYRDMQIDGREVTIRFDYAEGLQHEGDALQGFGLAGADGTYHPARAQVAGDRVVLSSDAVAEPVAVRYNWASYPAGTLRNAAGLPAGPFRTDNW